MKTYKFQPLSCGLLPIAIGLATICIGATSDSPLLQETATPDSDDVLILKSGSNQVTRKIKIGNLVPKPSDAGLANEVWVTVRTDGKSGDGSQRNPFDGSTQAKFDRLLASFGQNTVIHLGPGTLQTNIVTRKWRPLTGWKIRGAGMDVTTIQAVGTPIGSNYSAVGLDNGTQSAVESNNVEISDLTVDANYPAVSSAAPKANGEPNFKIGLITLMGSNNLVERVHGKNQYGSAGNGRECFGIRLAGFSGSAVAVANNKIRNCLVDSPHGTYNCPYSIAGSTNNDNSANGYLQTNSEVSNCLAIGSNDGLGLATTPHTAFTGGGVNMADVDGIKVHDNIFIDCSEIAYGDTHSINRAEIYNNLGRRVLEGVGFVSTDTCIGNRIYNNTIEVQNRNGTKANYGIGCTNQVDIQITGNKITYVAGGTGIGRLVGLSVSGTNGLVTNNIIDSHFINESNIPSNFVFIGNRTERGNLPTGLAETLPSSRNNSTQGALRLTVVATANPSSSWGLYRTNGSAYKIQSGDKLRCEVMSDIHNAVHAPAITVADSTDETGIADQNRYFGWQEVPDSAGRWLYREFDLSAKAGNSVDHLRIGFRPPSAPAGTYIFYYRNIEIVSSDGVTQTFLADGTSPIVADDSFSNTTSHSVSAINREVEAPSSWNSHGIPGEWAFDSDYLYVCIATNAWKRVATSTW